MDGQHVQDTPDNAIGRQGTILLVQAEVLLVVQVSPADHGILQAHHGLL